MFDYKDFKQILDDTTKLTEEIKTCPRSDLEEVQLRIDSNVHALQIMVSKIDNLEAKEQFNRLIDSFSKNVAISEFESVKSRKMEVKQQKGSELIDEELLKNTLQLKDMANKFKNSLAVDKNIIGKASDKMSKNSEETRNNLKTLEKTSSFVNSSTILAFVLFLFFVMYFIIRFF